LLSSAATTVKVVARTRMVATRKQILLAYIDLVVDVVKEARKEPFDAIVVAEFWFLFVWKIDRYCGAEATSAALTAAGALNSIVGLIGIAVVRDS